MDKFFLSPTLQKRLGKNKSEQINRDIRSESLGHIQLVNLNSKLVLAQHQQDPIFYAVQKSLPAACLITVYYDEEGKGGATHWTGSGFLLQPGLVITSNHVLPAEGGQSVIKVSFDGDNHINANVYLREPQIDIGILAIQNTNVQPVQISQQEPMQGEQIAVIGAPEGWDNLVTIGYVSAVHQTPEKLPEPSWNDMIFIDADIYEGSSGSMVINNRGEVIGVVMGVIGKEAAEKNIGQNAVVPIEKVLSLL